MKPINFGCVLALAVVFMAGCRSTPTSPPAPSAARALAADLREVFPGVLVSFRERFVEFEGVVPIDCHNPVTPRVYLELLVCTPDTKEHESLVMTRALPSHVHAGLLALGLEPGSPGSFRREGERIVPVNATGPEVGVLVRQTGGEWQPLESWVINADTGSRFAARWLFAGSRLRVRQGVERYDADGLGTLVGLTTFGAETIAAEQSLSPEAAIEPPSWIADIARTPIRGTPVTVRIQAVGP